MGELGEEASVKQQQPQEGSSGGVSDNPGADVACPHESSFRATAALSVSLSFEDITYRALVKDKGKKEREMEKVILSSISGLVRPGTFVAIMGPSGAGKTCLLNVLAGRVMKSGNKTTLTGQVLVNGRPRDESFRRISAYVMQDDAMFSCLTVWETLWVAARLRLPGSFSLDEKRDLAEGVILELGLDEVRNTLVGGTLVRGASGGERKRTSIAVEMLSNPSLVFLDEPTSGLDSFQAQNIVTCLADLAHSGRTVLSTIHQPRSSIFAMFEDLILLSEGRMVYFGKARDAVAHFSLRGCPCPELHNPADFFMDTISVDRRDPEAESVSQERVDSFAATFQLPRAARPAGWHTTVTTDEAAEEASSPPEGAAGGGRQEGGEQGAPELDLWSQSKYATGYWTQFVTLCLRAFWQVSRDRLPLFIAWLQALVMAVVVSLLFYAPASGTQQIQNLEGGIFFTCIFLAFNGIIQMIVTFPHERPIVTRERACNTYHVSAYFPAKVLVEWPFRVLPPLLFITITYWPLQFQRTADKFFLFLLTGVFEFTAMATLGLLIGAATPRFEAAIALAPVVAILCALFGGFFVNLETIPVWLRWLRYLSPIQWGFVGLTTNQFTGLTFDCSDSAPGCVPTGEQVLVNLNVSEFTVGEALGFQAALILGLQALAFGTLWLNGPRMQPLSKALKPKTA